MGTVPSAVEPWIGFGTIILGTLSLKMCFSPAVNNFYLQTLSNVH